MIISKDRNRIFLMADIHGQVDGIHAVLDRAQRNGCSFCQDDILIILGDHGALYYPNEKGNRRLKKKLNDLPCKVVLLKGNHDGTVRKAYAKKPDAWYTTARVEGIDSKVFSAARMFVEKDFPNIYYLDDYFTPITVFGKDGFALGGAYSVDKFYRLEKGLIWHEDEQPDEETRTGIMKSIDYILKAYLSKIEIILSHEAPISFVPYEACTIPVEQDSVDNSLSFFYDDILQKLIAEQPYIDKEWYFGHYHINKTTYLDSVKGTCIDIGSFVELK